MMMKNRQGFTLIELMIVIAIIGILATMALPSYQDRIIRAQVREALVLADLAKVAVQDFYTATNGGMPKDNIAVKLPASDKIIGNYTTMVAVNQGVIELTLGNRINKHVNGKVITLRPAIVNGEPRTPIAWVCGHASIPEKMTVRQQNTTTIEPRLLPIECRY